MSDEVVTDGGSQLSGDQERSLLEVHLQRMLWIINAIKVAQTVLSILETQSVKILTLRLTWESSPAMPVGDTQVNLQPLFGLFVETDDLKLSGAERELLAKFCRFRIERMKQTLKAYEDRV